ncbi:MAG: GNAT family N-acetyltransferase [Wenzhouxiangellaceae bacterium]
MAAVLRPHVEIRPMIRFDLDEVHVIEKASYPFPWSRQVFGDCLRLDYCCRVVDFEADVAGYAVLSTGAGESHLLNLCIGEAFRGRGLGRLLLGGMLVEARLRESPDVSGSAAIESPGGCALPGQRVSQHRPTSRLLSV